MKKNVTHYLYVVFLCLLEYCTISIATLALASVQAKHFWMKSHEILSDVRYCSYGCYQWRVLQINHFWCSLLVQLQP